MSAFVLAVYSARDAISILFLAIFISSITDSLVDKLELRKIPRVLGTIIVFFFALLVISLVIYTIIPIAILEVSKLSTNFGGTIGKILESSGPAKLIDLINLDLNKLADVLLSGNASFFDVLGKFIGGVTSLIVVLVLSFYLTVSRDGVGRFLRDVFPENMEDHVLSIYYRCKRKIGRWFEAQLFLGLIVGVVTYVGLWAIGVEYALVLAIVAGVFEIIPMVGPIFAGAVAVIIGFGQSPSIGLYVLLLFIIIQQVESHTLVPLVMRQAIDMHPVVTLISLIAGFQVAGFAGMLLAVPAAVVIQEVVNDWVAKKSRNRDNSLSI
jgi:predicted PurR-regulated permease PerM